MEAPRTPTRSGAVSPSKSLAMHHELYAQYDTLIKQIDRQRGEAFTRIHERLNRAQYISQVCSDQVNTLNTKLHNLEVRRT
jgi:dephospho-CoA kinase